MDERASAFTTGVVQNAVGKGLKDLALCRHINLMMKNEYGGVWSTMTSTKSMSYTYVIHYYDGMMKRFRIGDQNFHVFKSSKEGETAIADRQQVECVDLPPSYESVSEK